MPDRGHFGIYVGRYVPEALMPALIELTKVYERFKKDKEFRKNWLTTCGSLSEGPLLFIMQRGLQRGLEGPGFILNAKISGHIRGTRTTLSARYSFGQKAWKEEDNS